MPPNTSSKKSSNLKNTILIICLVILLFISTYIINQQFLVINQVEIQGINRDFPLKGLATITGQNLLLLSDVQVIQTIIDVNPQIKTVKIEKVFPQKIKLIIGIYQPEAILKVSNGFFILGSDGRILSKIKIQNQLLPFINYYQKLDYYSFNTGDKLSYKDILWSLDLLKKVFNLGLKVDTIDINGLDVIALHLGEKSLLFSTERDIEIEKYELETIIKQFKISRRDYKNIDFRFDKPIVELN
jgi:hypothetical protein